MHAIELEKVYNPKDFEDRLYSQWEEKGCFKPEASDNGDKNQQTFTVVIPPPNVTGVLHAGHALNNTLQDIVVRYHRMKGDKTLWVPGTDHAGIATQNVVERKLKAEGTSRRELGREDFLKRTWQVKDEHHEIITKQLKKLGASVDWDRERFTMDEGLSKAVRDVFVTLYERGLIYRGKYLVNWCTSCGTALADDEVDHTDKDGFMYHIFYEVEDGSKLEIATTRPETLLGDTAVAVHPEDERYKHLIGKNVKLPLTDKLIPIIADTYVEREFGTGVVKITPGHDNNDWEVGKRHDLPVINILTPDGKLNEEVPAKYQGLNTKEARKAVIADLTEQGLYKEEKKINHSVGHCYRCDTVVEPYLSEQWFVKMKPLAEKAVKAWKQGEIIFYPKKWENTYSHWMENIRDWCISRQLWWGHRIPVWYCETCGEMTVSRDDITTCPKCSASGDKLTQDNDVLDTWFSSWLWPFSTLGWPETTIDLQTFYPTTALITAYDIIFFWVSRMIMAGLEFTGQVPFRDIYIHGLLRDKKGRKMSKSLGNGIDPLEIIDEYGADSLKFSLAFMCAQGQDILLDKESFKMGSRFANKIWNASRYILGNLEGREIVDISKDDLTELDKWIYGRLTNAVELTRNAVENYRYNDGAQAVYEFFWNDFCDWYVEGTKLSFRTDDESEKNRAISVLLHVLEESMRLLHPYVSFVTEEIYSKLPRKELKAFEGMLINAPFPSVEEWRKDEVIEKRFNVLQDLIRQLRSLRIECGIAPDIKLDIALLITPSTPAEVCNEKVDLIKLLSGVKQIQFVDSSPEKAIGTVGEGFEAFILMSENIDINQLKNHFTKEIEKETSFCDKVQAKLNGNFAKNAPADVVEAEKEKLASVKRRLEKLQGYVKNL